ncbi:hypothetical protein BGW41_002673 [Actinomortierella wolfii]|nr:hypothetical protein BGW41_002673 [Actinomortierella wolfii]
MADEDDYMSESFLAQFEEAEKASKKNMTYSERRRQKQKEHLANQIKSHKEREEESRTKGLQTELGEENKGMQMLLKMGFKKGGTLGASSTDNSKTTATMTAKDSPSPPSGPASANPHSSALRAPLAIEIKQGRGGLGMDTVLREQENQMLKEKQAFDEHFRERKGDQYLQDKYHRQLTRAQSLCMELDTARFRRRQREELSNQEHANESVDQQNAPDMEDAEGTTEKNDNVHPKTKANKAENDSVPALSRGNAFWWISDDVPDDIIGTRALGRPAEINVAKADSEESGEETTVSELGKKRLRSADMSNDDHREDEGTDWVIAAVKRKKTEDKNTHKNNLSDDDFGNDEQPQTEEPSPLWGEYPEFASLEVKEKLDKVVEYLRNEHAYCFWCHAQYEDESDLQEHCPGPNEDDH